MNTLRRLRALRDDPASQAAEAVSLLSLEQPADARMAALEVLAEWPAPEARESLLHLYDHYAKNGPKRDPGAYTRSALLRALGPVARPEDGVRLRTAVATYENLPPDFSEEASMLRAAALLALNQLEDPTVAFHAARLIVDEQTDRMSGEPALTAVRVLANRYQLLPIYQAALTPGLPPEVHAACLQGLTGCPPELLPGLIARYGSARDGVLLMGLVDLLLDHERGPQGLDWLRRFLADPTDLDVFRYAAIQIASRRDDTLLSLLHDAVHLQAGRARLTVLAESLAPFVVDDSIAELHTAVLHKLSA